MTWRSLVSRLRSWLYSLARSVGRWLRTMVRKALVQDDEENPQQLYDHPNRIEAKDAEGNVRAEVITTTDGEGDGTIFARTLDALGATLAEISITDTATSVAFGTTQLTINADGSYSILDAATNGITKAADGSMVLSAADTGLQVTLGADGSAEINGSGVVRVLGLPSADPEAVNQLFTQGAPAPAAPVALMVSGGPA